MKTGLILLEAWLMILIQLF